MQRLHSTLSTAQNPSLLELRILTNHSSDPKFQFLKKGGKWREVWERIRRGEKIELASERVKREEEEKKKVGGGGLAGLGDYGSSDSGSEGENDGSNEDEATEEETVEPTASILVDSSASLSPVTPQVVAEQAEQTDEEERRKKEAKAEKVREWARKRREARQKEEKS